MTLDARRGEASEEDVRDSTLMSERGPTTTQMGLFNYL